MHNVTYRFFEIRIIVRVILNEMMLELWCHKHPYLQTFFSSVFIFCVNSNCIREIIKNAMLSPIHLKNRKHTSFPQSFRDSKI